MNEEFVKNIVMNDKIDPKVVMDLSFLKDRWMEHFTSQEPQMLEAFVDENEPWLIGISNRDPFFATQHL